MNLWMLSIGYAGGLAVCSVWAGEWARRKGLNAKAWRAVGLTAGPLGVMAVGLRKAEASLCPHCKTLMRFDERFCTTCRANEMQQADAVNGFEVVDELVESNALVHHGFFENSSSEPALRTAHAH